MTDEQQITAFKAIRAALGLDQRQVSSGAGLSERTYIEAEKGRRCTANTIKEIAAFYGEQGWYSSTMNGKLHIYQDAPTMRPGNKASE